MNLRAHYEETMEMHSAGQWGSGSAGNQLCWSDIQGQSQIEQEHSVSTLRGHFPSVTLPAFMLPSSLTQSILFQSILFTDLIFDTIPLKSSLVPSVFSSSSCSRAGQTENQIINNDRCKKILIFILLQFGAPNEAGPTNVRLAFTHPLQESLSIIASDKCPAL